MSNIRWFDEPKLVKVIWDDATNVPIWMDREDIENHWDKQPQLCENIGYLIAADDTGHYVAARKGNYGNEDDAWGLVERVPAGCVREIITLGESGNQKAAAVEKAPLAY